MNYTAPTNAKITLGNGPDNRVNFDNNAQNASAIFNNGNYILDGEIENAINNNITFNDTTLYFANTDTKNIYESHYTVKDSSIDLRGNGINEVTFTNLDTNNSNLNIDVNLNIPEISTSDRLIVNNTDDRQVELKLTEINLSGERDIGLHETHTINDVVGGDLSLSEESLEHLFTKLYHYNVELSDDKQDLLLTAIEASNNNSLKVANQMEGTRGFDFRDPDDPYEIESDLGATAGGTFNVWGDEANQKQIILSGGGTKSFFDIVNNTEFTIHDLTIKEAENTKGGSVINASNADAQISVTNVDFASNTSSGNGGVINNTASKEFSITESEISGNSSSKNGGAIYNSGNITLSNSKFNDNSSENSGGAIYNSGNMLISDTTFENNSSKSGLGGAIYTSGTMNFTDVNFSGNTDGHGKNDIYLANNNSIVNLIAESAPMSVESGLAGSGTVNKSGAENLNLSGINNRFNGNLNIINGDLLFEQKDLGDSYISGNTHINSGREVNLNIDLNDTVAGSFSGNGTLNKNGAFDAAISGNNSSFKGTTNINEGSITFNKQANSDKFFGGKTNIASPGTLNINSNGNLSLSNIENDGNVVLNSNNNISLSKFSGHGNLTKNGSGILTITGQNRDYTGDLNINSGTFAMAAGSALGKLSNGSFAGGTTIDLQNTQLVNLGDNHFTTRPNPASFEDLYFDNLTLNGDVNFNIDVDLEKKLADKIGTGSVSGKGNLIIGNGSLNVLTDTLFTNTSVEVAYGDIVDNIKLNTDSVMGPIQKYSVSYEEVENEQGFDIGNLVFTRQGGISPDISQVNMSIMAAPVATQIGGYLTQLETLRSGFYHMDRYSKYPYMLRLTAEKSNVNAIVDTPVYKRSLLPETSSAMWVKPYTTFEQVNLDGGVGVSNVSYGTLYGGDSDLVDLGHGFKGVMSYFIGYNGNHMSYNGISMNQQGGTLGATGTLYKGNFFTGLTVSTGASAGDAYTLYGTDNFAMLTAGVASKTGYNLEIKEGKIIVQPSLFLGYTFVNTFDYTNAVGIRLDSDPLHAIQIVPGVKIIGNLKNGWQPYLGVNMVWSIMDKTSVMANDVYLPQLSVKPYVEYGVGVQKSWGERFTAFFQTMLRNGGRTGVALTAGFRWTLGKDSKQSKPANTPAEKKVIKSL